MNLAGRKWLTGVAIAVTAATFTFLTPDAQGGTINLATGLNSSGGLIGSGGQSDANWSVPEQSGGSGAAQTVFPGNADWYSGWLANGPNSDWIARDANNCCNGPAPYSFDRTFTLFASDVSTVSISGYWTIDDAGTLTLNGNLIGSLVSGDWGSLWWFYVPAGSSFFHVGINTLTIIITSDDDYLEGARLEGTLSGTKYTIPEPSSFFLLGSGLLGMAGMLKRKYFRR